MKKLTAKYSIGVDEVGRGPLAGPVTIGAFAVLHRLPKNFWLGIRDSKKLSEKNREKWLQKFKEAKLGGYCDFAVSFVGAEIIDRRGISFAVRTAIARTLKKLKLQPEKCDIFLDGCLKAPGVYKKQKTIIRGDETVPIISASSIIAKVKRDRRMKKMAKVFPSYDFEQNKGYGSKVHIKKILKFGPCEIHRRSYIRGILSGSAGQ